MSVDDSSCAASKPYSFKFIGDETDIDNDKMLGNFDTNYLNLNYLPVNYYPIYKADVLEAITKHFYVDTTTGTTTTKYNEEIKVKFENLIKEMNNDKLSYNRYTIAPVVIVILLVWIFIMMYILKYIHYHYNIYYIYFITTIIIGLLVFGSLWFLYVNSELI